jgi:uncharacterized membrane protein
MTTKQIRNAVFTSAVALALAFGAGEALARSAAPAQAAACPEDCYQFCVDSGFSWGFCNGRFCQCFID